ncbi:MAG: sugar ABC transporter ATP-binding protein [Christensenellales bacterium]
MNDDIKICSIKNICKDFPGVKALNSVCFDIEKGEIHALVGENGAGKSTLLNIMSGVYQPSAGHIEYDGKRVNLTNPKEAIDLGIAMIHQELSLSGALSIAENIFQARLPKKKSGFLDKKKLIADSMYYLEQVGLGDMDPFMLVRDINVSQQQQVEIAKALSLNANILILDEPTSSLTTGEAKRLLNIMRALKQQGITMINVTHKLDEVMEISDRITVLRDGELIGTLTTKETTIEELISMMVGRQYSQQFKRERYMTSYENAKPILEVEGLRVGTKVKDVSFKLYEGEILGITGLVGAGRSEVLQSVFGADKREAGTIKIDGKTVRIESALDAIKNGIGLVPEGRKQQGILSKLSVKSNISVVNLRTMRSKLRLLSGRQEEQKVMDFVNKLSIKTPTLEQKISNLSGGNQQKSIIARWLMNEPRILFLDEPTQGIDVGTKAEIYKLIDIFASMGMSIIIVSSEMVENLSLCDRILVMYEGVITGELLHAEATEDRIMALASNQPISSNAAQA